MSVSHGYYGHQLKAVGSTKREAWIEFPVAPDVQGLDPIEGRRMLKHFLTIGEDIDSAIEAIFSSAEQNCSLGTTAAGSLAIWRQGGAHQSSSGHSRQTRPPTPSTPSTPTSAEFDTRASERRSRLSCIPSTQVDRVRLTRAREPYRELIRAPGVAGGGFLGETTPTGTQWICQVVAVLPMSKGKRID
jgi:hypothetical protein